MADTIITWATHRPTNTTTHEIIIKSWAHNLCKSSKGLTRLTLPVSLVLIKSNVDM